MRRGAQGTGVERKAEEVRPRPPGCPLPFLPTRGNSPHPQPGLQRRRGRGRRLRSALFSSSLLQTWVGRESACSAAPRGCRARTPELCVCSFPVAGQGTEPAKVSENAQSAGSPPGSWGTRVPIGPWPPSPRAPSAQRERKTARGGPGELEPVLVVPAPAQPRPCFRPGMLPQWVAGIRGSGFSNTFVSTHATGARAQPRQLQTARPDRSAADGVCELARCALRSASRLDAGCVASESPDAQDARHALCSPGGA